jgi:pantoate--beta-alanine ligase
MTARPVVCESIVALRECLASAERPVGLVPTMGALHDGHTRLIDAARDACATVVVSIFVNPLQFDREEDLRKYPRVLEADLMRCAQHGVDLVFAPTAAEMYPRPLETRVTTGAMSRHLCGAFRPGHFDGVATVVLKLFEIVRPERAYFGEKDAQQLAIIRRLVADFNLPLTIVGIPIVREHDGLALSSRNTHLSSNERALAPALFRALSAARGLVEAGVVDPAVVRAQAAAVVDRPPMRLEYFEIVDPETLQPAAEIRGEVLIAGALWLGTTRLIDNMRARPVNRDSVLR